MAHAYFADGLEGMCAGTPVTVVGDEAKHAAGAARLRVGEHIDLLDGCGTRVAAEVTTVGKSEFVAVALADARYETRSHPHILLVQALAKHGRDELALQAAVELGVDEVVPWQAQRSIVKWQPDKADKHRTRWQTIAREASKQALRAWVPRVRDVVSTKQLAQIVSEGTFCVLDPSCDVTLADLDLDGVESLALVVGPEGGIDDAELTMLESAGALRCRLGRNVLRTSTAGPAAIALLLTRLDRW